MDNESLQSRIYKKLLVVVPDMHTIESHGKSVVGGGIMDLCFDVLSRTDSKVVIALSHYYKHKSGDMIADPDMEVAVYQSKLSGPLMDRIDLHVEVPALPATELLDAPGGESSACIQLRCTAARARAHARQGSSNQALAGQHIDTHARLDPAATKFLQSAAAQLGWSARGTHRTLKIARTIADLAGTDTIQLIHLAEAMQYRRMARTS